ncbi:MAG TPA: hypothetical protein VFQ65_17070, partial [Kofleriaceae bacterium]|nr:hypothetical protein [Kofleriaceae bacterium]
MRWLVAAAALAACKPDLGEPASLVTAPRLLAVESDPAEVAPGAETTLTALVADATGTLAPDIAWGFCTQPAPLDSDNVAGDDCIYGAASLMPRGPQITATIPIDACSQFGPTPPPPAPGEEPRRPRDADVTGGYYQPIRVLAKTSADPVAGIGLSRISCDLANAPLDAVLAFRASYHANTNPVIVHVVAQVPGETDARELPAALPANTPIALRVRWSDASAEMFPVFEPATRDVVMHREAIRVSWFVSDGELAAERTGRTEDEAETYADNTWTVPEGPAHLWVVVR